MITMKEDLVLRKEGEYWTLYLGENSLGCGDLDDMVEALAEVADKLESGASADSISAEYNDFR